MTTASRTFGGRYAVIERAGTGGMAEVYRARDELLGREVAVKVLSERLSSDQAFVERFRREAQAAANLNHPNVVSLYDYGSDDTTYYIVMEFIDGLPLADVIQAEGPLLPERAAEIASDVARALERAHSAGLVHRDVKPSNIMIDSSSQTKVTDFGIARALARDSEQTVTQTGMVIGTAAYLSPEQAQGNPVDPRSDVYSLGCVLYEMLTGEPPFAGDSPLSIAYKHVRENPEPPSALNPDVPAALDAIVMKALAKNPDNRYQSAAEFREDLDRFLSGQRVQATPMLAGETMVAPAATGTQVLHASDVAPAYPAERRRGAGFYILIALLVLGVLGALAFLAAGSLFGNQIEVPDVVGQTRRQAEDALENAGLEVEVDRRASRQPPGRVIEQDPEGGESIDEGGTVLLVVSSGPQKRPVPDVVGLTSKDAEKDIERADLELGEVSQEFSSEVPEDTVISQDPPAGEKVEPGTVVNLVVSAGPELVTVPSVEGQTEDEATAALEAAGLVAETTAEPSDEDEGTVIDQEPDGGVEVEAGSTVVITVSEGPEEFPLPDVGGRPADSAEAALEGRGLVVSRATEDCGALEDRVCGTDPAPGTLVVEGDSVTLFVQPPGSSPSPPP